MSVAQEREFLTPTLPRHVDARIHLRIWCRRCLHGRVR
jgi:hypothetical protein